MTRPGPIARLALLAALLTVGCQASPRASADAAAVDRLLRAIAGRLALMPEVARWKWNHRRPIADPDREAAVIEQLVAAGVSRGLEPGATQAVVAAQIEAGKQVQRAMFARWEAAGQGEFAAVADLEEVVRPRLDAAGQELIAALAEAQGALQAPGAAARVRRRAAALLVGEGIDEQVRETALAPIAR